MAILSSWTLVPETVKGFEFRRTPAKSRVPVPAGFCTLKKICPLTGWIVAMLPREKMAIVEADESSVTR